MALYKQEGVNPAGGCLPLLLQMPLQQVLSSTQFWGAPSGTHWAFGVVQVLFSHLPPQQFASE